MPSGRSKVRMMRVLSVRALPSTEIEPTTGAVEVSVGAVPPRSVSGGDASGWEAAGIAPSTANSSPALSARRHGRGSRFRLDRRSEVQPLVLAGDPDVGAGRELTAKDELRERVLEQTLDRPLEGSSAQRRVEAPLDE